MSDMPEPTVNRDLAAKIVAAYVRRNQVGLDQMSALIASVHQALGDLGKPKPAVAERVPAVPIRKSVQPDRIICVECGWSGRTLRRHLSAAHGLSPTEYRARWNLPREHPIVAPDYRERHSALAKLSGLGRTARAAGEAPEMPTPADD